MKKILFAMALIIVLCPLIISAATTNEAVVTASFVSQSPDPVPTGGIVELRFKIENFGSVDANDLQFQLVPAYPFLVLEGENYVQTIGTLSARQNGDNAVFIKYRVKIAGDAKDGIQKIDFREIKGTEGGVTHSISVTIKGNQFAQIIYVDKAKIDPGKETPLKFTINNLGNSPLQNLIFSWSEKNNIVLPVYSDNTKYIKFLEPGKSIDVDYIVIADTNAARGLYQIDLNLQFDGLNGTQKITTKAGIYVGGDTDFDVAFSQSSAGQTSLSIANTGNNPALSVTVSVPQQDAFRVTGSSSAIVGNLDKGDYTVVSFQIASAAEISTQTPQARPAVNGGQRAFNFTGGRTGGASNLTVLLDYTDVSGIRHSITKNVPIRTADLIGASGTTTQQGLQRQRNSGNNNLLLIGGGIAIVIVAISAFFFFRKKSKATKR